MNPETTTSFLTYYLRSLAERTRVEKSGTKFGFDWVIYNIGLSQDWLPARLPFTRAGGDEISKTKSENEFGVDFAFLTADRRTLIVFVLKDEILNSNNWGSHSFDIDLRKAAAPDLTTPEMSEVCEVRVILAYNKDEDQNGIELFQRLVSNQPETLRNSVALQFERWNLSALVERVRDSMLSPSLLPQKFFSQFSYLCSQFADFRHGSDEWEQQLIPNWRRFLITLLDGKPDERSVRLVPVALIVLREHGKANRTLESGWLDLIEWALLALWNVVRASTSAKIQFVVSELWQEFYLCELERYYTGNAGLLAVEHGLNQYRYGGMVDTVASAAIAHWHLGRLGLLAYSINECVHDETDDVTLLKCSLLDKVAGWIDHLLQANPGALRPLLDIQHIELFLVHNAFSQIGRSRELCLWMMSLQNSLAMRRFNSNELPFLSASNKLEIVFDAVAMGEPGNDFCGESSVFLTCLLELCFALPEPSRNELLGLIYRRLVLGCLDDGPVDDCKPINLMLWLPPEDWVDRVLSGCMDGEGECVTLELLPPDAEPTDLAIANAVREFVDVTRRERPSKFDGSVPLSVVLLACLKQQIQLVPEIWRSAIFPLQAEPDAE